MATQSIKGGLMIPNMLPFGALPAFAQLLLDASGEKAAFVFMIPKTGTLDKFEFMTGTVTVNAASQIRCSFEDVSTVNGDPDGTQDQYRDIAGSSMVSGGWNVPGLMTSDGTDTGTKRSVTRGQILAAVVGYSTFTAADVLNVSVLNNVPTVVGFPYADFFTASWAKQTGTHPVLALKYDDGTYEYLGINCWPISAVTNTTFNSGSTPDEVGNIFQLPFPARASGVWLFVDVDASGLANFDVVLYDSDGTTALQTISVDANVLATVGVNLSNLFFGSTQALLANTSYRVVVKPTTTTNANRCDVTVAAAAIMDAIPGGQNWHLTQRTDAGAWTQTTTRRVLMGLLIDGFDDAVGGSTTVSGATRLVLA